MTNPKVKFANVLLKPRVTEKASLLSAGNVFTFEIDAQAGKEEVAAAIRAFYNVTPLKVRVVRNPAKKIFFRGKPGSRPAVKKAYVYLKKGETINLS